ncbi:MAG: histidine phosphatase family protein [Caulobacter sp.]
MIYLCRHGQTQFNREGRLQGQTESDLTALGRAQARAMGDLLADLIAREPSDAWRIVASPLRRARHTAEAIAERTGLPLSSDERLLEISVGEWSGRLREDVRRETPELTADPEWAFRSPGGETFEDVAVRVGDWLAGQTPEPERRLIVVSHGIAGRLLRGAYAGLSRADTLAQEAPQDAIHRLMGGQIDRFDCAPVEDPEFA